MSYTIIQPPFTLKLREMSPKELNRYYQWFMEVLPQRVNELTETVRQTPGFEAWQPDCTPASLDTLGQWFAGQVETRKRTQEELRAIKDRLVFLMDIPSEELTNRFQRMEREDDRKFADYGQPCLSGFGPVSLNPVRNGGHVFAHGLASKTKTGKRLREVYDYWAQRVQPAS